MGKHELLCQLPRPPAGFVGDAALIRAPVEEKLDELHMVSDHGLMERGLAVLAGGRGGSIGGQ